MELSPSEKFFRTIMLLIMFLVIWRALALRSKDPKPHSSANQIENASVKGWMIAEVGVDQTVLTTLQSHGLCLIEAGIPRCIEDLLANTKLLSDLNPSLLQFLQSTSSHETLAKHLWKAAQKKKQKLILIEWLRQNNLLTSNLQGQLEEIKIYSMSDLVRLYETVQHQIGDDGKYFTFMEKFDQVMEAGRLLSKDIEPDLLTVKIFKQLTAIPPTNMRTDRNSEDSIRNKIHELKQNKVDYMQDANDKTKMEGEDVLGIILHLILAVIISVVIWFLWDIGVTPNEFLFDGVPIYKSRTRISWSPRNENERFGGSLRLQGPPRLPTSNTKAVIVSFFSLQGQPIQNVFQHHTSMFTVEVWLEAGLTKNLIEATLTEVEAQNGNQDQEVSNNQVQIIFSGQRVGKYTVILRSDNQVVRGFPSVGIIIAGAADPGSTCLVGNRSRTLVITAGSSDPETIRLEPRDAFGNKIIAIEELVSLANKIKVVLWKRVDASHQRADLLVTDSRTMNFVVYHGVGIGGDCLNILISFAAGQEGWYTVQIQIEGRPIRTPKHFTLIVINRTDRDRIDSIIGDKELSSASTYFEAEIVGVDGKLLERNGKYKKVYVYLTGKQLTIKDYFLKFIPRRLYTFRLAPATKVNLVHYNNLDLSAESTAILGRECQSRDSTIIEIDDGYQARPQLVFKDHKLNQQSNGGTVFAACYHLRLLQRLGGSETFQDKQTFFNLKLVEYHQEKGHQRSRLSLTVERWCIVRSSYQVTKWFTDADWVRLFEITFEGEPGIDQGGLRREWFEVLCRQLFHPSSNLFVQAEEGSDAVHPNPNFSSDNMGRNSLKMYKFAGKVVGKCLLESAYGTTYRQQLPVRFAKSFLALIVGLRVQYKHFSYDAPDFYSTKIQSILKGCVDDETSGMDDLTFSEEEYDTAPVKRDKSVFKSECNLKIIDLKPNGSKLKVTEANKHEYLDLLAQYKLCDRFKEQTAAFLDGLHRVLPDSLLSLFDEHELELLLCGIREYNLPELKKHHTVVGGIFSRPSEKILNWFWLILANFTTEQMARLVQFTTGSSQLPQGGFAELKPIFQIGGGEGRNHLPTAHTCFNMICLPEHDIFINFEQALLTAITEGNEGFGLA